jgi:acetyltransferase-like isoleucine patch superfamily enzyme
MAFFAHPTAVIEAEACIGSGTYVWHHSHVRSGGRVGSGCVLGKNVYVDEGARIGDRCKIQNNVSVYNGVVIGDDVFVGPAATFTNDRVPRAFNHDWSITPTTVEKGASIGANATIVCGLTVGEYSMVAAGSTVTRSVSAYQLVGGSPARHMGWVCQCGAVLTRSEERPSEERCQLCQTSSPIPSKEPTGT